MKRKTKKILLTALIADIVIAAICAGALYYVLFMPNVNVSNKVDYLYVSTGSTLSDVMDSIHSKKLLKNETTFNYAAKIMRFNKIKSGRYKLVNSMNNKTLIRMISSGNQTPVRMTFSGNIRSNAKIASIASRYIEADSMAILAILNDDNFLRRFGFNSATVKGMFIPNTYEIYWNSSADDLIERMNREYEKFWNADRKAKLDSIGLSRIEAITLASIVNEESNVVAEMPRIAGVYMNRLKTGMLLQADPTLKFAFGDFSIRRVLDKHKEIDSPFNTYLYAGLPPAPICMPSIAAIDAVLNYEHNDYYYFCANSDFSGTHVFAKTLAQHNLNSHDYHRELNKRSIY